MKLTNILETYSLQLNVDNQGKFWLYDKTRGMNLSIRSQTKEEAFIEAIEYYQKRLLEVENEYSALSKKVSTFVDQFREDK